MERFMKKIKHQEGPKLTPSRRDFDQIVLRGTNGAVLQSIGDFLNKNVLFLLFIYLIAFLLRSSFIDLSLRD